MLKECNRPEVSIRGDTCKRPFLWTKTEQKKNPFPFSVKTTSQDFGVYQMGEV